MEIVDLIAQDDVIPDLPAHSKRHALELVAERAAEATGLAAKTILDVLMERERLGTTGVGRGIAIPHGRTPELKKPYGLFARLHKPIAFDAVDDQPVDLIFLLLAPQAVGADHLKALARVSRTLRDCAVCDRLRSARTAEAIYAALAATAASHAA